MVAILSHQNKKYMKHAHQSPYKLLDTTKCDIDIIEFGISAFDISIQFVNIFCLHHYIFTTSFSVLCIILL